ncbi:CDP-alcohol phosphatidyltransferase family protein [Candidatus Uhrbacteria bacterium]|nr:CDP-alcohol phosphatidyltransferase family protein [Candidatus Uhrbacteria bacterium]
MTAAKKFPSLFDGTYLPAQKVFFTDRIIARVFLRFLPPQVVPNHITLFRMLATPFVLYLLIRKNYDIGIPFFLLVAFSDAADGALARTRNKITEWGMMFDPLADKMLIIPVVIFLVIAHLPTWIASTVIGIEILIIVLALFWRRQGRIVQSNIWGKIKMCLQVLGITVLLFALFFDLALAPIASGIFIISIACALVSIVKHGV